MSPLDAFWHVVNFLAPALGVAALAAALAKLLWRRELAARPWLRLAGVGAAAGSAALVLGLLLLGQDGRMFSYAGLVLASAVALWWDGFLRR
jgi:hypothetical protein